MKYLIGLLFLASAANGETWGSVSETYIGTLQPGETSVVTIPARLTPSFRDVYLSPAGDAPDKTVIKMYSGYAFSGRIIVVHAKGTKVFKWDKQKKTLVEVGK